MRATTEERAEFGRRLDAALETKGWSQSALRDALAASQDITTSRTAVSNWVNGRFAPDRRTTRALDDLLATGGTLSTALGYGLPVESALGGLPESLKAWIDSLDAAGRAEAVRLVERVSAQAVQQVTQDLLRSIGLDEEPELDLPAAASTGRDATAAKRQRRAGGTDLGQDPSGGA